MQSTRPIAPAPPFSTWPIHCSDAEVGYGWYVGNCTIVTQISVSVGSAKVATVLCNWMDELYEQNRGEIDRGGGIIAVHDWRRVESYQSAARTIWLDRMKHRPEGYKLRKAVVITSDNALLKMAVAGANLISAVSLRGYGQIETSSNAHEVLREYAITAPGR